MERKINWGYYTIRYWLVYYSRPRMYTVQHPRRIQFISNIFLFWSEESVINMEFKKIEFTQIGDI